MVISFSNKKEPILYNYKINEDNLDRVSTVKDLGVYLTHNLNYSTHINAITLKAFKLLGFIKRASNNFNNVNTLKTLYITLVRSQLEYATQVWSPPQQYLINRLERVQRKFVKYLCGRVGIAYSSDSYGSLCAFFKLPPLQKRRQFLDMTFFYKCMFSFYDCSEILQSICFNVPSRSLRSKQLFKPVVSKNNVHSSAFLQRSMKFLNTILTAIVLIYLIVALINFVDFYQILFIPFNHVYISSLFPVCLFVYSLCV